MWHEEQDWEKKKDQHERHESRNQSIIEGVMQSLIVAYIVVQKYYEENPDFAGYDSFWTSMTSKRPLIFNLTSNSDIVSPKTYESTLHMC